MFTRLQQKWGVSTRQFWILFLVFGLTGTTTAILTRYVTGWLGMDAGTFWVWKLLLRLFMLLFGYQVILLSYGALLGQWAFFWKYEKKLLIKLGVRSLESGGDTTPNSKIPTPDSPPISPHPIRMAIQVALVVCNKPGAGVLAIAETHHIPTLMIEKERFFRGDTYLPILQDRYRIDFIVLAGFLWKVPDALVIAYPRKIINIHPALLPKYGGKGMYGMHVHEAVIAAGEKESGITIHYVNEHFDEGEPIFQASCPIEPGDSPAMLAQKVHALEHKYFPGVVEKTVEQMNR